MVVSDTCDSQVVSDSDNPVVLDVVTHLSSNYLPPHPLPKWLTVIPIAPTQCWWRWQQSSSLTAWLEVPPVRPVNWVSSPPPPPPSSSTSPPPHPSSPTSTFKKLNSTKLFHHHNHILPTTLPTTLKAYSGSWRKFSSPTDFHANANASNRLQ